MDLLHHQKGSNTDLGADTLRRKKTMQPLVQPQIAFQGKTTRELSPFWIRHLKV
ncbi:hypothetical protein D8674_042589 [Pyrus ussuriensis x Pyrus communis]|uniref:Uncharacterized protein n=1 Tax=Pyrus ussuriensis x Pyrus communis TaxID=2448454 RepID=A0A5N5FHT4_9ROSA|nr:hypothetical protein D8674_039787 [Pyrus ussuriensis x Pyrus communis]KAB2620601.1 hypothetical protein D8674_042589 [Pyrus ussuriensis x Pyrus communis]